MEDEGTNMQGRPALTIEHGIYERVLEDKCCARVGHPESTDTNLFTVDCQIINLTPRRKRTSFEGGFDLDRCSRTWDA